MCEYALKDKEAKMKRIALLRTPKMHVTERGYFVFQSDVRGKRPELAANEVWTHISGQEAVNTAEKLVARSAWLDPGLFNQLADQSTSSIRLGCWLQTRKRSRGENDCCGDGRAWR